MANRKRWHKSFKTMVPLKYLSNSGGALEMPLINCEISVMLKCFLVTGSAVNQEPTFTIADTKINFPVITLSTQDNVKLLAQIESGFRKIINSNKYQSKITTQKQNQYLDLLIDPSFQRVNRLFVLSFEDNNDRESYKRYFLPKVDIKDQCYN